VKCPGVANSVVNYSVMFPFALLGPVPPGGTGKLPGIVLLAIAAVGLLTLPSQMKKLRPTEPHRGLLFITVAIDVAFLIAGVVMVCRG